MHMLVDLVVALAIVRFQLVRVQALVSRAGVSWLLQTTSDTHELRDPTLTVKRTLTNRLENTFDALRRLCAGFEKQ